MKKLNIITLFSLIFSLGANAQNFEWAKANNGASHEFGNSVVVDASGNVYSTGSFNGTVDFDPGPGTINLTTVGNNDAYVQKLDASGNILWANAFGGVGRDNGVSIAVDASGNIYTTGRFEGTVDFDAGSGTTNLTSVSGGEDIYVQKLDASGNFLWAKSFGGTGIDRGESIAIDASGNIYTTGIFSASVDFDPGSGTVNLTSVGNVDVFVQKMDASGNFLWAKSFGSGNFDHGNSLTVDASGNVYTTGVFTGTIDFDPGAGTTNLTAAGSNDSFVQKLDVSGNFLWAKSVGGTSGCEGESIAVDASGNVYTSGDFSGTADFDPGLGITNLTATGSYDSFVQKLDASGNFLWAKTWGGTHGISATSIAVDASGNVYTAGRFLETIDFDPGSGTVNLTSVGAFDIFVHKMDISGNFLWAQTFGGTGNDRSESMVVDALGNIYNIGFFDATVDFDPGAGTANLTSAGGWDIFVHKMNQCTATTATDVQTACDSYTWINGVTYASSNNSAKDTLVNAGGCDSVVTLNLTITNLSDYGVSASHNSLCVSGSTSINTGGSDLGVNYYLRDDANDTIVVGPIAGTGSGLSFNTGTINNSMTYNVSGGVPAETALQFNGTPEKVIVPNSAAFETPIATIEMWVRPDNSSSVHQGLVAMRSGNGAGSTRWSLHMDVDNNRLGFYNGNNFSEINTTAINVGQWYHIAFRMDGSQTEVFLDGVSVGSIAHGISTGTTGKELSIGTANDPAIPSETLTGAIDNLRIWNIARTDSQILNAKDSCFTGAENGLVALYNFENGSGITLTDVTGNGHNGTLTNMDGSTDWVNSNIECTSCKLEMSQTASVTVLTSSTGTDVVSACDSYTWNGIIYTSSNNTAKDTLVNATGCDSVVTLDLTINSSTSVTIDTTIDAGTSITNGTSSYDSDGSYIDTLQAANGCDSIVTLNLTVLVSGVNSTLFSNVKVFPNPTQGPATIDLGELKNVTIFIYNNLGEVVYKVINTNIQKIQFSGNELSRGIYYVRMESAGQQKIVKLIKQ